MRRATIISIMVPLFTTCGIWSQQSDSGEAVVNWRQELACGINCAYMLLKYHGVNVAYGDLVARIPLGENGSELARISDCCEELGLENHVFRLTPSTLSKVDFPVLAHVIAIKDNPVGGLRFAGHYVVLLQRENRRFTIFDPSASLDGLLVIEEDAFFRSWSGYAIAAPPSNWPSSAIGIGSGIVFVIFLGLTILVIRIIR